MFLRVFLDNNTELKCFIPLSEQADQGYYSYQLDNYTNNETAKINQALKYKMGNVHS